MNIILGGTHGLGKQIADELQNRSEQTYVIGRSYNQTAHGDGRALDLLELSDVESLEGFIHQLGDRALEGFYWISGYGYNGDFANQPDVYEMAKINFANVLPIAQMAWKKMLGQQTVSHFTVVSSTTGVKARKDEAVYAATKHAQVGFTRSLGLESERLGSNIKVALFMPGGMQTPFWRKNMPVNYDQFLDPAIVAHAIVTDVDNQQANYYERTFERNSL